MLKLKADEQAALMKPVDPDAEVAIRPDGIVYLPAVVVSQRLDEALGPGRWAIRQERDPFYDEATQECLYDGSLWIDGKFAARAVGGCKWRPSNYKMSKSDALEGAKSDCIKRCGKALGIGRELWTKAWQLAFTAEWAEPYQGADHKGKPSILWRKKGEPLSGASLASVSAIAGEFPLGFSPDSPVPDGEHAGEPLRDMPDDYLLEMSRRSKTIEWKLSAKAEIVRRHTEQRRTSEDLDGLVPPDNTEEKDSDDEDAQI
jgi:hypothetical protein